LDLGSGMKNFRIRNTGYPVNAFSEKL
jgi:hypothetical protein